MKSLFRETLGIRRWSLWVAVIAVIGLGLWIRVALFSFGCETMPAIDDECVIALQAKQIARGDFSLLMLAQPYLFPLEAYLMAPWMEVLPRTAFGARVVAFSLGLLSLLGGCLILRRWGRFSKTWPGWLLLLFASPFLLILQGGLALPGYASLIFLSTLMVWLIGRAGESVATPKGTAWVVGILGGLACSVTLLSLPVLIMAGAMIGIHRSWRMMRWTLPLFILGAIVGALPYEIARFIYKGEGDTLYRVISGHEAWDHFMSTTLSLTLPAALGMGCPVVPGSLERIEGFTALSPVYGWIWFLTLMGVTLKAVAVGWNRWRRDRWPTVDAGLLFSGVSWICLIMFLFSSRSQPETYRYLTLIVWAWPFLIAYGYMQSGRVLRVGVGVLVSLILVVNLVNTAGLLRRWTDPTFTRQLKAHDLDPVIRYLDSRGIRHAYSTYAVAYRLTYATDERIICAQLYNERFPAWPIPYKTSVVDPATNVAYVLGADSWFTASVFERDMESAQVTCRIESCGAYKVYTDFVSVLGNTDNVLFSRADASHGSDQVAKRLNDPTLFWRSDGAFQQTGMWVSVGWTEPRAVGHVLMSHGVYIRDRPDTVYVYYEANENWVKLPDPLACLSVPFMFSQGHPVYGSEMTRLDFPFPVETTGIKLEIVDPRERWAWTIHQIGLAP